MCQITTNLSTKRLLHTYELARVPCQEAIAHVLLPDVTTGVSDGEDEFCTRSSHWDLRARLSTSVPVIRSWAWTSCARQTYVTTGRRLSAWGEIALRPIERESRESRQASIVVGGFGALTIHCGSHQRDAARFGSGTAA